MSAGGVHSTRLHGVHAAGKQSLLCHLLVSRLVTCMLACPWRQKQKHSTYLYRMLMRPTIIGAICVDTSHAYNSGEDAGLAAECVLL